MIALSFIAAFIDIQKVIDDVDLSVLEENLANISLCNIEEEMVRSRYVSIPREYRRKRIYIQYLTFRLSARNFYAVTVE